MRWERRSKPLKLPDPTPDGDRVVLEMTHCGICGSDRHLGQYGLVPPGTLLGHEFA